jgi:hypothetical protein
MRLDVGAGESGSGVDAAGGDAEARLMAKFLSGFAWTVPRAFAGAVAACRFEQGDVLYSHRSGYGDWAQALEKAAERGLHQIQVLDPPKTTRALPGEGEGGRFQANWGSPVQLTVVEGGGPASELSTTQGRLFSCLWHGGIEALDPEAQAPTPPALARDLHAELETALPAFRKRLAPVAAHGGWLFVWVVDEASDASRVKAARIEASLGGRFEASTTDLTAARARVAGAARFHPALLLRGIAALDTSAESVEEVLKALLYAPGEGRESKPDRFSLARHGLLAPLVEGVEDVA